MPIWYCNQAISIPDWINVATSNTATNTTLQQSIIQHNQYLLSQPSIHITLNESPTVLYVQEQEIALYQSNANNPHQVQYVGSADATTCVILAVYDTVSKKTVVAHINNHTQVQSFVQCVVTNLHSNENNRVQLHLVGSFHVNYGDKQQTIDEAINTVNVILNALHTSTLYFNLCTYMVCHLNQHMSDQSILQPLSRQLYINTDNGTPYINVSIDSDARGAALSLRRCYLNSNQSNMLHNIYNTIKHTIQIDYFPYRSPYNQSISYYLVSLSDHQYCQLCSTSPLNESDVFVQDSKESIRFLMKYPTSQHAFRNHQSLIYQRVGNTNQWQFVSSV